MAIVVTDDKYYAAIADVIRSNYGGKSDTYTPEQMPEVIGWACSTQYSMGAYDGYEQGMAEGHIIKNGAFTPTEDISSIHLDIPSGAKMVEIIPQGTPSATETDFSRVPVHYLLATENFKNNNVAHPGKGVLAQYLYNSQGYTSFFTFNTENGVDIVLNGGLVFEANMTYNWTAHYWQA